MPTLNLIIVILLVNHIYNQNQTIKQNEIVIKELIKQTNSNSKTNLDILKTVNLAVKEILKHKSDK